MLTNRSIISGVLTNFTNLIISTMKKTTISNIENQSNELHFSSNLKHDYLCKVALVNQQTLAIKGRRVIE